MYTHMHIGQPVVPRARVRSALRPPRSRRARPCRALTGKSNNNSDYTNKRKAIIEIMIKVIMIVIIAVT